MALGGASILIGTAKRILEMEEEMEEEFVDKGICITGTQ